MLTPSSVRIKGTIETRKTALSLMQRTIEKDHPFSLMDMASLRGYEPFEALLRSELTF